MIQGRSLACCRPLKLQLMLAPPVGRALDTGFQDGAELFSVLAKGWSATRSPAPLFKAAGPGAGCCWAGGLSDVQWA